MTKTEMCTGTRRKTMMIREVNERRKMEEKSGRKRQTMPTRKERRPKMLHVL
jgi:hypothetical protein